MSIFFLGADLDGKHIRFMLDSTDKVQVSYPGKLTKYPVQNGSTVSDNYVNENVKIAFSGRLSDIKTMSSPARPGSEELPARLALIAAAKKKAGASQDFTVSRDVEYVVASDGASITATVESFLRDLRTIKSRRIPLTVEAGEIGVFPGCFFNNLSIVQDKSAGTLVTSEGNVTAVRLSFSLEQVRFGRKAEITTIRDPEVAKDFSKMVHKAGTKKVLEEAKKRDINTLISNAMLSVL